MIESILDICELFNNYTFNPCTCYSKGTWYEKQTLLKYFFLITVVILKIKVEIITYCTYLITKFDLS